MMGRYDTDEVWTRRAFDTSCGRVLEGVFGDGDARGTLRGVRNGPDLRGTLAEVGPLVGGGVGETICHCTVRAVNDTGGARVLDTGDGLFIWVHGLREGAKLALGLVPCRLAKELRARGASVSYWALKSGIGGNVRDVPRTLSRGGHA